MAQDVIQRKYTFDPRPAHVGFMVVNVLIYHLPHILLTIDSIFKVHIFKVQIKKFQ